jgi:AhpD family alkylhydroperoxidase
MRKLIATTFAASLLAIAPLAADEPPAFMTDTFPAAGVSAAWEEYQAVFDPDGALDARTKELIATVVAAQIPCDYCVHFHRMAAQQHGASDEEIKEALAAGALVRKWSMMLQGHEVDMSDWREQVGQMFAAD